MGKFSAKQVMDAPAAYLTESAIFSSRHGVGGSGVIPPSRPAKGLRPEWAGQPKEVIAEAARTHGREAISLQGDRTLMAHSGDTRALDAPALAEAQVRVLDTTFLRAVDRRNGLGGHAALEEWVEILRGTPGHVILHHVSLRYDRITLKDEIRHLVETTFPGGVSLLDERGCTEVIVPSLGLL